MTIFKARHPDMMNRIWNVSYLYAVQWIQITSKLQNPGYLPEYDPWKMSKQEIKPFKLISWWINESDVANIYLASEQSFFEEKKFYMKCGK